MAERRTGFTIEIKGTDQQAKKLGLLTGQLTRLTTERQKTLKAVKAAGGLNAALNQKLAQQTLRQKNLRASLNRTTKAIQDQGQQQKKTGGLFTTVNKAVTNSFKGVGLAIGVAFGARAVLGAIGGAINIIKDFQQEIANLQSITGATAEEIKLLSDAAKELGGSTAFTASEVAKLQTEFAKLGFSTEEILAATEATLDLAAAARIDLPRAAAVAGSTVRAFGLTAEETERVVNVMAASFAGSALDISKFETAISSVGPVAKATGFSIEETTALLGTLSNAGLDASTAGTSLRNIFLELNKRGLTLEEGLAKVRNSTDSAGTALDLFGKRGVAAGIALAGAEEETAKLTKEITGTDAAAEQAAIQLDTLGGDVTILKSAYEGFILSVEDGNGVISRSIRFFVRLVTNVLKAASGLGSLSDFIKENRIAIVGLTTALVGLKLPLIVSTALSIKDAIAKKAQKIATIASTIAQKGLNKALKANPIGLIITAVGLLVAGFGILFEKSETVRASIAGIGEVASTLFDIIRGRGGDLGSAFAKGFNDKLAEANELEESRLKSVFDKFQKDREERLQAAADARLAAEKAAADQRLAAEEAAAEKRKKAAKKAADAELKSRQQALRELKKLEEEQIAEAQRLATEAAEKDLVATAKLIIREKAIAIKGLIDQDADAEVIKNKRLELEEERFNQELTAKKLSDGEKELAEFEHQVKIDEINQEFRVKRKTEDEEDAEFRREQEQFAIETFQEGLQLLGDIASIERDNELKEIAKNGKKEQKILDKLLADGSISQAEFDDVSAKLKEKADQRAEQANRKAFNTEKVISLARVAINTAQAISKGIAQFGPPPSPPGIAAIAAAAAIGLTQAGIIAANKFNKGGRIPGQFDGKDDVLALLSRGETILTPTQRDNLGGPAAMSAAGVPGYQDGGRADILPSQGALPPAPAAAGGGIGTFVSREDVVDIVVNSIGALRVEVLESDITGTQKRVEVIEAD